MSCDTKRIVEKLLLECNNQWMEYCPSTSCFSLFDLLGSEEFVSKVIENISSPTFLEDLKEILYTVGFDKEEEIHICKRLHRPMRENIIINDYVLLYRMRKDKEWLDEFGSLEDIRCSIEDESFREELLNIENRPVLADSGGSFREMSLAETDNVNGECYE